MDEAALLGALDCGPHPVAPALVGGVKDDAVARPKEAAVRSLLVLDALFSWVASLLLLVGPSTTPRWRRVAAGWAPALPAAYLVVTVVR